MVPQRHDPSWRHSVELQFRTGPDHERQQAGSSVIAEVRVPTRPDCVAGARASIRAAARQAGLSRDRVDDLLIAASEAVTNAMEAQLEAGIDDDLLVRCVRTGDTFALEVRDRAGGGFDASLLTPRPALEHPEHLDVERGWGIQLMRELVDRIEFDAREDGTVVRLVMELSG